MDNAVPVWAFDVDGTLIGSIRSDRLRPGTEELLRQLLERGVRCVLWSAGGGDYARRMAEAHGVEGHFSGFYGKEARAADGRFATGHFSQADWPTVFVDDMPGEVPLEAAVIAVSQFMGGNPGDAVLLKILEYVPLVLAGRIDRLDL